MKVTQSKSLPADFADKERAVSIWRFALTFGLLVVLSEAILRGVGWAQYKIGFALYEAEAPLIWVDLVAALANGLLSFLGLVSLFAFFEWKQLGFNDFRTRYAEGLLYGGTAISIGVALQALAFSALRSFEIEPLLGGDDFGPLLVVFPVIYMVVIGFFEYWLHRALHDVPMLWRLHAIHHQIEGMNAARSYSHWAQDALYLAVITIPLVFLIESPQQYVALLTTFYLVSNYYMHSDNPALSFPPFLRHILADNIYHHYHHSRAVEDWGRNYCSFFSFYDRIFGTQHMPQDEKFHPTGIDGYRPLEGWRDYLVRPFTKDGAR
ncbi:sterol desaturase family protein [Qipengyuania sp. DGS5-3]|uniref:sterol desaturase family protein n=1 Tax=Qipengyuania sp. DGS5-3 TaxID=3349632 RepID=UPI0036D3E153